MSASSSLSEVECLIVQAVIENTIDQLAIVGGTIQLSLPAHGGHHSIPLHQNATQKPLEELILREHKQHQKVLISDDPHCLKTTQNVAFWIVY